MAHLLFQTAEHAALYNKYKKTVPSTVIQPILKFMSKSLDHPFNYAIDVGCGCGQSTEILSQHFICVTGVDISENQITNANNSKTRPSNVHYRVNDAENLSFVKDNEVDLLTAGDSFQWLPNRDTFLDEAQRILKPGGTLAIYSSFYSGITSKICDKNQNDRLSGIWENVIEGELRPYWDARRSIVKSKLQEVTLPFSDCERYEILVERQVNLKFVIGFIESLSAYQKLRYLEPAAARDLLMKVEKEMLEVIDYSTSSKDFPITKVQSYSILLGRKE